ncbi:hypothetical protein K4039_09435 [Lyngbya sp. CCAP 1446/10]|uniref:HEPN domain-containing protein n=1 Tax=Lyngbya sp. CCAP 1446/10 TaxID=439293 RepID=UPI00223825C7|nr:HEPN domain-containing protein [Lyngbya sp. CCAP 1446/10]MCW6050301.1 hypothetical protein [Lyngbya sp. CCAP 1446/10]
MTNSLIPYFSIALLRILAALNTNVRLLKKAMNLLQIVNEIIELAETGDFGERIDVSSYKTFGSGDYAINFVNENNLKYIDAILRAFNSDEEIKNTYTLERYESLLIKHFREFFAKKCLAKEPDVSSFLKKLEAESIKTFSVFRDIHGIVLNSPTSPLLLGGYTIYEFASQKEFIESIFESKTNSSSQLICFKDNPEYLIEWKAEARHSEKALEIADEHFERFELILRYLIGSVTNHFEVGVLNYQGWRHRKAYILSDMGEVSSSLSNHGPIEQISLDNPYFVNEDNGYHTVWGFTTKKNLNKFQKRIMLAVEWIGQSMADPSPQSAFIKAAIALEIIFTYNEREIITPSIMNQMSESIALILRSSVDERLKMESKVKKMYGLRSKIVHSGNKDISQADYQTLLEIARHVIIKILTSDKLNSVDSVEDLYTILKKIKYSGDAI